MLPLTPLGESMLAELPSFLQSSSDFQAIQHSYAKEIERLEEHIKLAAEQANPPKASLLLSEWERTLGLPVEPVGLTEAERRNVLLAFMGSLATDPSGTHWWSVMRILIATGMIAVEHEHGVEPGPAANEIHVILPFGEFAPMFGIASRLLRRITPAHIALSVTAAEGFMLDKTLMDHTPPMH